MKSTIHIDLPNSSNIQSVETPDLIIVNSNFTNKNSFPLVKKRDSIDGIEVIVSFYAS